MSFASDSAFHGLYFDILELCGRFLLFLWVLIWKNMEICLKNSRFSGRIWPDWGNTRVGRYGRIGVYRVYLTINIILRYSITIKHT